MKYFCKRCTLVLQLHSTVADVEFVSFLGLSLIIFFIVLQKNCKLKQISVKEIDKRKVLILIAIQLKKAHTYNTMWQLSSTLLKN